MNTLQHDPIMAIFALSICSIVALPWMLNVSIRRLRMAQLKQVMAQEDGAAYSISYMMVIPVYALLVFIVIETAGVFPAKIGSVYAAYSAARTANVWSSATNWENAETKAIAAGRRAFVPFASATQGFRPAYITPESARYVLAHQQFSERPIKDKYLMTKFGFAHKSVTVEVNQPRQWDDEITATVKYEFPFNVPGVARLLGQPRADGTFIFPVVSTVTLGNQGVPQDSPLNQNANTNNNSIGIGYGTLE